MLNQTQPLPGSPGGQRSQKQGAMRMNGMDQDGRWCSLRPAKCC